MRKNVFNMALLMSNNDAKLKIEQYPNEKRR